MYSLALAVLALAAAGSSSAAAVTHRARAAETDNSFQVSNLFISGSGPANTGSGSIGGEVQYSVYMYNPAFNNSECRWESSSNASNTHCPGAQDITGVPIGGPCERSGLRWALTPGQSEGNDGFFFLANYTDPYTGNSQAGCRFLNRESDFKCSTNDEGETESYSGVSSFGLVVSSDGMNCPSQA